MTNFDAQQGVKLQKAAGHGSMSDLNLPTRKMGIKQFSYDGNFDVRVIIIDGEPHFVVVDVCKILEHTNTSRAMQMHTRKRGLRNRWSIF